MTADLRDQLQTVRSSVRTTRKPPLITATLNEGTKWEEGSWVLFEPTNGEKVKIVSVQHLFVLLREAMRTATGDRSWSVRYASQIVRENIPFLHCTSSKSIMFDPFTLFRDPVREFNANKYFLWSIYPSQAHYFKRMEEAKEVENELLTLRALRDSIRDSDGSAQQLSTNPDQGENNV